jgi:hypothetical protein
MQIKDALGKIKCKMILEGSLLASSSKFQTVKKTLLKSINQTNPLKQVISLELLA